MANSDKSKTSRAKPARTAWQASPDKATADKTAAKTGTMAAQTAGSSGWLGTSLQFLREVRTELKKVSWPSKKTTVSSTGVVLVLVIVVSLYLGAVDFLLSKLMRLVIG